jgi:hypothetical protein
MAFLLGSVDGLGLIPEAGVAVEIRDVIVDVVDVDRDQAPAARLGLGRWVGPAQRRRAAQAGRSASAADRW